MADIIVQYNGTRLNPTPLVSYNHQFIDYGSRWGNVTQIDLNGFLTGLPIGGTGSVRDLASVFSGQFGKLDVIETGVGTIYSWSNVVVDEISFGNNKFYEGTMAPYSVKMRSYNVPSGIVDPVNEYTFTLGDDGQVTIGHKVSAKGIKNISGALNNAIAFVKNFTGRNPFSPAFMPSNSGVLMSVSENIDRAAATYSVNETYKYNTGVNQIYLETFSLNITDTSDSDYITLDANLRLQGSPVEKNLSGVESLIGSINIPSKILALGVATGSLARTNFSVNRDTGACVVDIKSSFISGYSGQEVTGFFDYFVNLEKDNLIPKETWKIEGEFFCKGPLNYRRQQLNSFKTIYGGNWRGYLSGLLVNSPLFTTYHSPTHTLSNGTEIQMQENTGQANFKISMTLMEGADRIGRNAKYSVEVSPSRWNFELLPSANIEGHYVVQDPQMKSRSKIHISVSSESLAPYTLLNGVSGMVDELSNIYVLSGIVTSETVTTGLMELSYDKEWIGLDANSPSLLYTKVVGSTSFDYVRPSGFKFGY